MRVVHIADVHWRGLSRHEEYRRCFEDMFETCRGLNPDCFVVAGDIVHSKTQGISPELIDHLNWWFTEMSRIAPVHVMLGNHDGLVLNTDRQDAISPILRALNLRGVHLYRDSGVFQDPYNSNVNWCVFSPFDVENYRNVKPEKGKTNIALYHGGVWGCHTDMDFMLEGECKMDFFRGFEFVMLGDIHKRQQMDADGRIWYCGSTIQQNYGESGEKGFLLWDIHSADSWDVKFYPVAHANPFVTVDWHGNVQKTVKACTEVWPSGARYRIRSTTQLDPKTQRKLGTVLRREYDSYEVVFKLDLPKGGTNAANENIRKLEVLDFSNPEAHKTLLREYAGKEVVEDVEFWSEVERIIDELIPQIQYQLSMGKKWSIRTMNFDNTFGYGADNTVDFGKLSGVVGLFGQNRCGKSSIPGTLMYGLYNSNDRGITSNTHIINYRKKDASTDITFSVSGKLYRLERQSMRYPSRGKRSAGSQTYLNLFQVDDDGCIIKDMSGEQRRETEKELRNLIGTSDEFMMTSFAAQGNMNAFINKGSTDRKKLLSTFMGLDAFDEVNNLIKEEAIGIKSMLKRMEAQDWVSEIRKRKTEIGSLTESNVELKMEKADFESRLKILKVQAEQEGGDDYVDPGQLAQFETNLKTKKSQLKREQDKIANLEEEVDLIQTKLEKYDNIKQQFPIAGFRRRLDNLEQMQRSLLKMKNNLDRERAILKNQKHSVNLLKEVPCGDQFPTCKFIAESHRNKTLIKEQKDMVSDIRSEVNVMSTAVSDLEDEGLRNKIAKYEAMLRQESTDRVTLAKTESMIAHSAHKVTALQKSIGVLNETITGMRLKLNENKSEELKKLNRLIRKLTLEVQSSDDLYLSNVENIGKLTADIGRLKKDQIEYDRLQVEWKVYDFLLRATSWRGIPTYVMGKQLPMINSELAKILSDVTGFTIELEVDERNTDIFINYGDSRRPVECASGMEKMVSSMALRVAMSNVSSLSKSDMFIVDEGFGALDPQNIEAVTNLLHRLKRYYRLILIISHVEVIKDNVDEIIEIYSNGPDSKVSYA